MKKRIVVLALAAAVVFAIPVAASADDGDQARPERAPIAIDERFETVEEAVAAVTERLNSALERISTRYAELQENEDVSEDVFEHMTTVMDHIGETLAAVANVDDFEELQTVLDAAREQRQEDRANRPGPRRGHRRGPGSGPGIDSAEQPDTDA